MNKICNIDGIRVAYDSYGTGDHALVCIHGWCCNAQFWSPQKPILERYRSIVVDVPGHGRSDAAANYDYSIENFANAIRAVLEQEQITKVVILGHSMGVVIATMFLRLYPDLVLGIFYADGPFQAPHGLMSRAQRHEISSMQEDDVKFRQTFQAMLGNLDKTQGEWVLDQMLSAPKHMRVTSVTTATQPHSFRHDEIYDLPALRIEGTFGPPDPRWKHHVPQLENRVWEGVGHFINLEDPDRFNKEVIEWISSHKLLQERQS